MKKFLITAVVFLCAVSVANAAYTVTGTLSTEGSIPKAPESVSATETNSTTILVGWDPVVGVEGYRVYKKKDSGSFVLAATVTTTSYTDSGLNNGIYAYQVQSF